MTAALIVAELALGGAAWRRVAAIADIYRGAGFQTRVLAVSETDMGRAAAEALMRLDPEAGVARPWAAEAAASWAVRAAGAELAHSDRAIDAGRAVLIRDRLLAGGRDVAADLTLVPDAASAERAEAVGFDALDAPLLTAPGRVQTPFRNRGGGALAGIWVRSRDQSIAAAEAVLARAAAEDEAPRIALAGPGASRVSAPPHAAVSRMPEDLDEAVFYRGVDLLIAPEPAYGAPRLELIEALRLGAAPLAVDGALMGLEQNWRMPRFRSPEDIAAYLAAKRHGLETGGLLAELRARADWSWSGLSAAAARQRERLLAKIQAMLRTKRAAMERA